MTVTIHLFRDDLRLDDNPALAQAAEAGAVVPLYVLDEDSPGAFAPGGASKWWLHHSLMALDESLEKLGSRLIIRQGKTADAARDVAEDTGADAVTLTRGYAPWHVRNERRLQDVLGTEDIALRRYGGSLLFEPEAVATKSGDPYKVFTPFWRACLEQDAPGRPKPAPSKLATPDNWPDGLALDDLKLLPTKPDWSGGLEENWNPGEDGAAENLERFLDEAAADYSNNRDVPGERGTSRLSPHLRFGEISPRRIWQTVRNAKGRTKGAEAFLREVGWREFCQHLLFHFPDMMTASLREEFEDVPWSRDSKHLESWQKGQTGYPIVDAGMRELWHTGWMHNRVRMVAASFLIKHLLVDWRTGADWFWDTLVDADPGNNAAGWQWVAGCGTDAAPYFRVFNPVLQGEKFDTGGSYVRHWVPEVADLPDNVVHKPWEAENPPKDYPAPIVEHKRARERALEAYKAVKKD